MRWQPRHPCRGLVVCEGFAKLSDFSIRTLDENTSLISLKNQSGPQVDPGLRIYGENVLVVSRLPNLQKPMEIPDTTTKQCPTDTTDSTLLSQKKGT